MKDDMVKLNIQADKMNCPVRVFLFIITKQLCNKKKKIKKKAPLFAYGNKKKKRPSDDTMKKI